jgi:hypothetical protein
MSDFLQNLRTRATDQWDAWQERRRSGASASADTAPAQLGRVVLIIVVLLALYYPLGMLLYNRIDDDTDFQPSADYAAQGGSKAVATAAALIDREADHWLANKPMLHPAAALDNAPNFQLGVIYAVSRFAMELGDYIGRMRGSSSINSDLDQAAGLLKYDGRTWYWGQGNIIPTAKAESQYRTAVQALLRYNKQVAAGNATFDRRADNLIAFLDRVAADLGSASATLDARAKLSTGYFDTMSDDDFYDVKGKLYGYYLILRDVGADFEGVIQQKNATAMWQGMLESLRTGAEMDPLVVANGRQDSMLVPSHLAALGFHLLRARQQIREIGDVLQK